MSQGGTKGVRPLSRRAALLTPLVLAGCETIEGWFSSKKVPLAGNRESLAPSRLGFAPDENAPRVEVPPAASDAAWPQPGGDPTHLMGHLAATGSLNPAWSADLGEHGGYRRKILARPVAVNGVVFAMDADAMISAYDLRAGARLWRTKTVNEDLDSTNVGGGLCWDSGTLYAVNGMSELLALDPAKGIIRWRHSIDVPARSAPTVAEGRIFLTTIDSKLLALSRDDGHVLWTYQATQAPTTLLGGPAPAVAQGVVVAGFGSGEVAALRTESGTVVWTDGLGIAQGPATQVEFLAILGEPVISNGQVYVSGIGGLTIAADLLTGRRVWERRVAGANTPWIVGNWLFMISTEEQIGAITLGEARVSWVADLPRWVNPEKKKETITWFGPVLAGGNLIALGSNNQMMLVSPVNGQTVASRELSDAPSPFPPVVVDGTVLVVTEDGKLTAYR
jgi:outer membrane protein assembly factor BamB